MRDHCCDRDRPVGGDVVGDIGQLGERALRHRLDEDVEDAAAGQSNGERIVIADAVTFQPGRSLAHNVIRELVHRTLDAPARNRPTDLAVRRHHHRRSGRPRRRSEGTHNGADTSGFTRFPDGQQLGQDFAHRTQSRLNS